MIQNTENTERDNILRLLETREEHNINLALQILSSGAVEWGEDIEKAISETTLSISREFVLSNRPRHITPFDFLAGVFENHDSQVQGLVYYEEKTEYGYAKDFFLDSLNSFFGISVHFGGVFIEGCTAMKLSYSFLGNNWNHTIYTLHFI